jgi:hypothetical protein
MPSTNGSGHVNRIEGLLFSQGIFGYETLHRNRRARLDALQTGNGCWLPQHLKAHVYRGLDPASLATKIAFVQRGTGCLRRSTNQARIRYGRRQLVRGDIVIKVYDNAFSPFARKVRMVLEFKGLDFDAVDGLLETDHEALKRRERAHQDASSDRR